MTTQELLSQSRSELKDTGQLRYKEGTTTSAGAADGSTLVSTSLGGADDAWNQAEVRITSGDNSGQRRQIGDYVSSTGTISLVENFTHQVANSVTFEIGEKGFISDHQLIEWFTEAQDKLVVILAEDAFPGHSKRLSVAGTGGTSAALPTDLTGAPSTLQFKDNSGNEYDVTVLPPSEHDRFREDAFMGSALSDMVAIFQNGKISYRPTNNGTLLLPIVPKFNPVTFSGGSQLPTYLHQLQITWAVYKGWKVRERLDQANAAKTDFIDLVNAINAKYGNNVKLTKVED